MATPLQQLRDRIRAKLDVKHKDYEIPEWGEGEGKPLRVVLRGMSAWLFAEIAEAMVGSGMDMDAAKKGDEEKVKESVKKLTNIKPIVEAFALMIESCTLRPETKEPFFDEGDRDWIKKKSFDVVFRLGMEIFDLSEFGEEAVAEAGKD